MTSPARLRALLGLATLVVTTAGAGALAAPGGSSDPSTPARTTPFSVVQDRDVQDRLPQPEDRYAVAGGCYAVEVPGQGFVVEQAGGFAVRKGAAGEPFHFQATRLGEYLLATDEGPDTRYPGADWDVRGYLAAASTAGLLAGDGVQKADAPSEDAEWRLEEAAPRTKGDKGKNKDGKKNDKAKGPKDEQAPAGGYVLSVPARDAALVVEDGRLRLVEGEKGTPLALHLVTGAQADSCARWPEIDTDTQGRPAPTGDPAAPVQGFFEAHVHGMAFEFLGGELRCGRPWHEYGVEHALGNCAEERNPLNAALEVGLAGQDGAFVAGYDPVGWPTFKAWPQQDTLTHEQYYWRWLERAYLGGLRLTTNLLVENEALCKVYPVKKNSCNEMDGVRLQAQRLFELQDYVDAQYGGPGEGWLRIVTSPAQAREAINAGRMAVVLGIEISALFDCTEYLDAPACTEEQIDDRLQEAYDMGVRQMELVNKFDNALSGVTGDGGSTGVVVGTGNREVTGHWWDMRTCADADEGHDHEIGHGEHDKTQLSATDATPAQAEGVDALAGRILDQFGTTVRTAAPLYGPGPHCNSRGLTELGEHLIRGMVEKGMIFDPDHMSAAAQRSALDLTAKIAAERKAAAGEGPVVLPAVLSSHSWGNEVVYQRIYAQQGVVAPRTADAKRFAERWKVLKGYAAKQAGPDYDFGLGYGADTNGLGGQPGPRPKGGTALTYPFQAPIGGVTVEKQTSGLRAFDVNAEGVSQYGMFADWFREVKIAAEDLKQGDGAVIERDMLNGAETYLGIWERAVYGGSRCVTDGSALQVNDLHALLGGNVEGFLDAAGQPADRDGSAYTYCAQDEDGRTQVVDVLFDETGTAVDVRPTRSDVRPAPGHDHGTHPHAPLAVPADGELALGALLVLGLTGVGAGTLTARTRRP